MFSNLQEPEDHQIKTLGAEVKLSPDHMFVTTASSEQLVYVWSFDGQEIAVSDKRFKNSDTNTLKVEWFECKYVGTYKCTVSTANQPTVSMSAKVKLDIRGKLLLPTVIYMHVNVTMPHRASKLF